MKRPSGLWILLSAGVLWLSLQDVYGIRATALIFAKSTTTTTEASLSEASPDETATEASTDASNVTKPTLTGNPQLDYIWDPNLPKELNGYNLSEYPFYERVPEDIDFKCDGLHDGFYASVPHKCQVYHHCLFGTRYDFLCANYTAFDQKTFICHFVSEVDCVNSKKYWHRNDALYQAASTTTAKPVIVYTPPPQPPPPPEVSGASPRRPGGGRRRPFRRRRPQYDYYDDEEYDDYYEERQRSEARRRKRPRPRPRPIYEDDYEEYEDDRYERRGSGRRDEERNNRKPYDRRDDRRPDRRRNNQDRRKYEDDDKFEDDDKEARDKRPGDRRSHKRRPADDYSGEEEDRRRSRPKGGSRRPIEDEYEDEELPQNDKPSPPEPVADKPIIKPTSGSSIYDRPRAAPKIKPPVPKSEASKYAYKPAVTKPPAVEDEEYYDDYEEEEAPPKNHRKAETSDSRRHTTRHEEERDTRKQTSSASRLRASQSSRESYEEELPRRPPKPKYGSVHRERARTSSKKPPQLDDYYDDDYEDVVHKERSRPESKSEKHKEKSASTTTTTTTKAPTTTTTTTTTTPKPTTTTAKDLPRPDTIVRIVKRPFLPSRGGNPYSPRGLQPVGAKAVDKKSEVEDSDLGVETVDVKPAFKQSPVVFKMPVRQKYVSAQVDSQEEFKPVSNRPQIPARQGFKPVKEYSGPRTTQKPKLLEPDPLDEIEEDEYDVTLNDALNPTLPNLPVRGYPTGFSSANEYNYNHFQRPRYVLEGASTNYYQTKPSRQRYDPVPYSSPQEHFVNTDTNYKGQYSTIHRESYRPRVTQALYSSF
jgi:hypothetical protein